MMEGEDENCSLQRLESKVQLSKKSLNISLELGSFKQLRSTEPLKIGFYWNSFKKRENLRLQCLCMIKYIQHQAKNNKFISHLLKKVINYLQEDSKLSVI
jgi:hypothetical protein